MVIEFPLRGYEGGVNVAKKTEKTKEQRIESEKRRLGKIFKGLDENKLKVVTPLIQRAAFITVSLEELEEQLNETGWTEEYQNGREQSGMKKSAAADVHISLTKNLNAIVKQLLEIVPPAQRKSALGKLMNDE